MTTPTTPAVPTLAQLTSQMLVPCLPHILTSGESMVLYDPVLDAESLPVVSQKQIQAGKLLWDELWPDISQDYETVTAVQKIARTPDSPLWQSILEQGLISIFSRNEPLARRIAEKLREM